MTEGHRISAQAASCPFRNRSLSGPWPPWGSDTFESTAAVAENPRPTARIRAPVPAWRLRLTRGKAKARFLGGDRALAITSGSHQGQAIRIDSSAVDDCLRFSDRGLNQSRNLAVRFVGAACPHARHEIVAQPMAVWFRGDEPGTPGARTVEIDADQERHSAGPLELRVQVA
jgi:hypothetical protein